MKCSLIFPAWDGTESFSKYTAKNQVNFWIPLGISYIAAMLRKEGHEVELTDGSFHTHEEIMERIQKFKPAYVGISSTAFGWKGAAKIARDVKQFDEKIHVSVGGPYPIAKKEEIFKEEGAEYVDSMCFTEGEYVTLEILERIQQKKDLAGVKGTIFRDNSGVIIVNDKRSPIENLDDLPFPARDLLGDITKYKSPPGTYKRLPLTTMFSSRGCSNLCIYCFQIYRDRHIRYRSAENVVAEIEECINKYGIKEIKFLDDQFTGNYERVEKICDLIREKKLDVTWYASAIANTVDKKLLKKMKDAGCWAILFGAETGLQKNLDTIQKNLTLDDIRNAVRWAKEVGIKPYTPFMFGIPGETYEDGLKTIDFACELNPNYVDFNSLAPFPGTTIYNNEEKYGHISKDKSEYTFQHVAFVPYTMTREDIAKLRQLAFKKFYSRPKYIIKKLFEVRNFNEIMTLIKGGSSLFWIWVGKDIFNPNKIKRNKKGEC